MPKKKEKKAPKKEEKVKIGKEVEEKINDCGTANVYDENNPYG